MTLEPEVFKPAEESLSRPRLPGWGSQSRSPLHCLQLPSYCRLEEEQDSERFQKGALVHKQGFALVVKLAGVEGLPEGHPRAARKCH